MVVIDTAKLRDFARAINDISPSQREAILEFIEAVLRQKKWNEDRVEELQKNLDEMVHNQSESAEEPNEEDEKDDGKS